MAEHVEASEASHVDARTISFAAAGIVAFLLLVLAVLAFSFPRSIARGTPEAAPFPSPSLRSDEREQRMELERSQIERLSGKNGGIAIERAMEMIAARGAKAYDPLLAEPSR